MTLQPSQPVHGNRWSRRQLLRVVGGVGVGCVAPFSVAHSGERVGLRVLAWPGYAEPEVVAAFEATHGVKVSVTTIDTDDLLWTRLVSNHSADFDVFAVNTAVLQRCIAQGLVSPIPEGVVPNTTHQLPRFRAVKSIAGLVHGAQTMAVPFTYADMGLIYDRRQMSAPPDSIRALWDPRFKGRVLAYNGGTHNFSLAAQALGLPPFRLERSHWTIAVEKLIALRRNVASFYSNPDESVALFRRHGAAILFANYGSQQLQLLRKAGLDVGYAIPAEGALAWLDCWAITRRARDPVLAAAWIHHLLGRQASDLLVSRQGLANTVSEPTHLGPNHRLVWLEPPEDDARRNLLWSRIVSGDSVSKVLAA